MVPVPSMKACGMTENDRRTVAAVIMNSYLDIISGRDRQWLWIHSHIQIALKKHFAHIVESLVRLNWLLQSYGDAIQLLG